MFERIGQELLLLLGKAPGCDWARMRFAAYYAWDATLSKREFQAIERHLFDCPMCAAEYDVVHEFRDAIEERLVAAGPRMMSTQELVERAMARIRAAEAGNVPLFTPERQARLWRAPRHRQTAWAAAAACLVILAAPVLAYVGANVFQAPEPSEPSEDVVVAQTQETEVTETTQSTEPVVSDAAGPLPLGGADFPRDDPIAKGLDGPLQQKAELALVEMLLPQTEDEYEAWARQEYPHIMWLYDVLNGGVPSEKRGLTQAEQGTSEDGSVPAFRASGDAPLWNGVPVNVPDWAKALYADTPESGHPIGWRALLIYSGDIFRFDWPTGIDEANCKPRLEALVAAAAVAGFSARLDADGAFALPPLPWLERADGADGLPECLELVPASGDPAFPLAFDAPPDDYPELVAGNIALAKQTLTYFALAGENTDAPAWTALAECAKQMLSTLCVHPKDRMCLDKAAFADAIERMLNVRETLLEPIETDESAPRPGGQ